MKRFFFVFLLLFSFYSFADDLDDLFENAEDVEAVIETPIEEKKSGFSPSFNLNGSFSANTGIALVYPANPDYITAGAKFTNTINFSGRASPAFAVFGSIVTTETNLTLDLSSFYFDYLFLNKVLITAGKKGIGWGNTQILGSNIVGDSSNSLSVQLLYPLGSTTTTLVGLYNTGWSQSPNLSSIAYAASFEATLFSTAIKLFARKWAQTDKPDFAAFGLEWKRTLFTVDMYEHALVNVHTNPWNAGSVKLISGFARIWEFSKKAGLVVEYQFGYDFSSNTQSHIIALQSGLSRLLGDKLKLGLSWNHDIMQTSGDVTLAAILPGAAYKNLPHAELQFGLPVTYNAKGDFTAQLGFNLSFSMTY